MSEKNIYVLSDVHNDFDNFKRMLDIIKFNNDSDELYIIGDIFDRGEKAVDLYFEIMKHPSVFCVKGNHDVWLADYIVDYFDGKAKYSYRYNTFEQLRKRLTDVDIKNFAKWINAMPMKVEIEINGDKFLLAHEHNEFGTRMPLSEFLINGVVGYTSIIGHTPTSHIREYVRSVGYSDESIRGDLKIWDNKRSSKEGRVIVLDCGNAYRHEGWGGRLGCVRLNDGMEYYV